MPNKYNIRAKRLALDNLIRERSWKAFHSSFSELSRTEDKLIDGSADDDDNKHANNNICKSVVLYRDHQTTHRTLLHSLCDVPSNMSPPPPELIRLVATSCPQSLCVGVMPSPLHILIKRESSLDTITALLEAADMKNNKQNLLVELDSKGRTPLLLAAQAATHNDEIIRYLVNEDVDGSSLLIPLSSNRNKQQQLGNVPLKYIASRESFHYFDFDLDSPDDLLRFMIVRTYRAMLRKRFPLLYNNNECQGGNEQSYNQATDDATFNVDDDTTCLLQATIFCYELVGSAKVASSILSYIIRNGLFHREKLCAQTDDAGNLTLHIACLSDTPKFDQILRLGDRDTSYGLNSEDCTIMEYLVNTNPHPSATVPFLRKNIEGDIPLHCAIKNGKDWSHIQQLVDACPSSIQCRTATGETSLHLAIKCGVSTQSIKTLWTCWPESASIVDPTTRLYPFQLAAIFGSGDDKQNHHHQQQLSSKKRKSKKKAKSTVSASSDGDDNIMDSTSLSFFLLRECPSLLSSSLF